MASQLKQSPAERLHADGWWSVLKLLNGNDIARVLGVSRALRAIGGKPGVWTGAEMLVKTPSSEEDIRKWRLPGRQLVLKSSEDISKNSGFSTMIHDIILNDTIFPNLQSLTLLQLPGKVNMIGDLTSALRLRKRAGAQPNHQLTRLVLELKWFATPDSWHCRRALMDGLLTTLPEEVEFGWVQRNQGAKMHYHHRDVIMYLLGHNESALKFTLPGYIWVDYDDEMYSALGQNKTIRSLTFKVPHLDSVWNLINKIGGLIACFSKMLVHPSLRHLSIADRVIPDYKMNWCTKCNCFTALYFADPESFSKSTLETLHLELGREAPYGLLSVLHCVADMPQLHKFTLNWPDGGHSIPQRVSMERLQEYLKTSELDGSYKERPKTAFFESQKPAEVVSWSTLETLFI
jgi:hypothetical protein